MSTRVSGILLLLSTCLVAPNYVWCQSTGTGSMPPAQPAGAQGSPGTVPTPPAEGGKDTSSGTVAPALRYFIGHEVVVVDVVATSKTTRQIEVVRGDAIAKQCLRRHRKPDPQHSMADPDLCPTNQTVTTRVGTAALKLVPNPRLAADITVAKGGFTEDELTIEFRDGMLLKSINAKSTGKAGEVLTSIAKFAGVLLGGLAGAATLDHVDPPIVDGSSCDPFTKPFEDLPEMVRLLIWENDLECKRLSGIQKLQDDRELLVAQRIELELKVAAATNAELPRLLERLKRVESAIETIDKDIAPRTKQFNASLELFTKTLGLGSITTTRAYSQTLQLSDLPVSAGILPGMPEGDVEQTVQFKEPALLLWREGKAIVTLDPAIGIPCDKEPTMPSPAKEGQIQIAFRQGTPARLRVFIADQQADAASAGTSEVFQAAVRYVADRFENLAHPCAAVGAMTFKRSAWSKRELALSFDEKGYPTKLESKSGSDAAAIAASVASSASAFRDEVKTTVENVVSIQENRRKIALDDATRRLDQLKKDKEVLDAQLALDAGTTNVEASIKQQVAAASLAQLNAEVALASAQATADQKREIDQLKVAIDLLKQELDLVRAQQELEKARK